MAVFVDLSKKTIKCKKLLEVDIEELEVIMQNQLSKLRLNIGNRLC